MALEAQKDIAIGSGLCGIPGEDDYIHGGQCTVTAKALTDQAAKPVAPDSPADFLPGDRETQARLAGLVGAEEDREVVVGGAPAVLEDPVKGGGREQPLTSGKALGRHPFQSDREAGAAFGAATLDDQTSAAGCHAGAKSMRADALQFAWLIGSFHDDNPWKNRRKTKGCNAAKSAEG